jgi:predicted deacylase
MTTKYSNLKTSNLKLPYLEAKSTQPGPTIWLTGCIHGDEVGGMIVIHEIFKRLKKYPLLKGNLFTFPLLNPTGFKNVNRNTTLGYQGLKEDFDLNRAFPGKTHGSQAQKLANIIFQTIIKSKPSLVLDLHNDWVNSIPNTLIDHKSAKINNSVYDLSKKYALKLGLPSLIESASTKQPKSLSASLLINKIPSLTLELGASTERSAVAKVEDVQDGIKAIWDLLTSLGMVKPINQKFNWKLPKQLRTRILKYSYLQPTKKGIIVYLLKPGVIVKKGQIVAQVHDYFGKPLETLKAKSKGLFIGHADYSVAYPGAEIISFGIL